MIMNIIIAIVILQIGTFLGMVISALMAAAKDPEPKKPKLQNPEKKETTKLWTVNNLCKWDGEIYEIKEFNKINGRICAILVQNDVYCGLYVPLEELEEVE